MTKKSLFRTEVRGAERIIPTYHIEADGRGKNLFLTVSGVTGVKEFSPNDVLVVTKRDEIRVKGELLEISVFESGSIGIGGKVESVSFSDKKRGRGV